MYIDMKKDYVLLQSFLLLHIFCYCICMDLIDVFLIAILYCTAAATGTSIATGPVGPALSEKALPLLSWRKPREETILKYLQSLEREKKQKNTRIHKTRT